MEKNFEMLESQYADEINGLHRLLQMRSKIEPYENSELQAALNLFVQAKTIRENISKYLLYVKNKCKSLEQVDQYQEDLHNNKLTFLNFKEQSNKRVEELEKDNIELKEKLKERENYLEKISGIADQLIPKFEQNDRKIKDTEQELNLKQAKINKYQMEKQNNEKVYLQQIKILNERIELINYNQQNKDKAIEVQKSKLDDKEDNVDLEREELKAVIEDLSRKLKHFEKTSSLKKELLEMKQND